MEKIIRLRDYAKANGIKYRAAWNRYKLGKIPGAFKSELGDILIKEKIVTDKFYNQVIIYARVSLSENKDNLDTQAERLKSYAIARGYQIVDVIKEIGSGVNDNRSKLIKLLQREDYSKIIVEHKDRLTRFGFNYIEALLQSKNKSIEVVNLSNDDKSDLVQDMISIIYSFSARLYGLRRTKRNTEKIIKTLESMNEDV